MLDGSLPLECGHRLICPTLHYAVYGRLNAARDNAVLVCHALSGSALVGSWWPEIFAPGAVLSLEHDFVICINMLGSCYGSTGPGSVNPETGETYGPDFPLVSVRDNVRAQSRLLDSLGIRKLRLVLGGSIGGMQALEWTILHPERVERALIIGVTPLSAMGLALNHLQRQAIEHDPEWAGGRYLPQRPPAPWAVAGAPDRHDQLQIRSALQRALRAQSRPQRRRSVCGRGRVRRPHRRPVRHRRLSRPPGKAVHRPFRRQRLPGDSARHGYLGSDSRATVHPKRPLAASAPSSASSASAPTGFSPPRRCASLPRPSARPAPMPITGRWKATTATTPFWPSRQSWCGCCNDAFHPPATARFVRPCRCRAAAHNLPWRGIRRATADRLASTCLSGARWLSIILLRSIVGRGIVISVAVSLSRQVRWFRLLLANEQIVVPISTVPRSTA